MGHGPLPPHERTWRHPSELGPTRADVDLGTPSHTATLAIGALAVVAVAALVVVLSPRQVSNPMAISATTTPATARAALVGVTRAAHVPRVTPTLPPSAGLASLAIMSHSVMNADRLDRERVEVARELPDDHDIVFVCAEDVTYQLEWALVALLDAPNGSVVFDTDGDVVGRIHDGDLFTLVDH